MNIKPITELLSAATQLLLVASIFVLLIATIGIAVVGHEQFQASMTWLLDRQSSEEP